MRQETPPPAERGGLSLGSPSVEVQTPRAPSRSGGSATARPSLRDQIASLGSGLIGDSGVPAKQTIPLDSREPRFQNYLQRLKARIQAEWGYPDEARRTGIGGELHLLFTLNRAGTLVSIRLLESSGYPVLDNEALRAVKAAAPYDPFPPQMGDEAWNILATFHYHSYRR
jgi:protein TonB